MSLINISFELIILSWLIFGFWFNISFKADFINDSYILDVSTKEKGGKDE